MMAMFLETSNDDNYACAVTITRVSSHVFMCVFLLMENQGIEERMET